MKSKLLTILILLALATSAHAWTETWDFEGTDGATADDSSAESSLLFNANDETKGWIRYDTGKFKNGSSSAQCYFDTSSTSQNFQTRGEINTVDVTLVDGTTQFWMGMWVYFGTSSDNPSSANFDWIGQNGGLSPVWKTMRGRVWKDVGETSNGGWDSIYSDWIGRTYVNLEFPSVNVPSSRLPSPAFQPSVGTWYFYEYSIKYGTTSGTGQVVMWVDGVEYINTATQTMESDDDHIGQFIVWSTVNQTVRKNQYAWIDDLYISTDGRQGPFSGGSDTTDPSLSATNPENGDTGIALTTDIAITLADAGGIVDNTVNLTVEGVLETADLIFSGSSTNRIATLSNSNINSSLTYSQVINVDWSADDASGNSASGSYSFTLQAEPVVSTVFATGTAGDRDNYVEYDSSRWQINDESGNNVYLINTTNIEQVDGEALGEYTILQGQEYEYFEMTFRARSDETLGTNGWADYNAVIGYQGAKDYHFVMFNQDLTSTSVVKISEDADGFAYREATYEYYVQTVSDNNWHNIKIRYEHNTLVAYQDGVQTHYQTGISIPKGKLGLGTYNDQASFDDVVIIDLSTRTTITAEGTADPNRTYFEGMRGE